MSRDSWWENLDPFDAVVHIAVCMDNLLAGVEDGRTLKSCQRAAEVWMRDLTAIREAHVMKAAAQSGEATDPH